MAPRQEARNLNIVVRDSRKKIEKIFLTLQVIFNIKYGVSYFKEMN